MPEESGVFSSLAIFGEEDLVAAFRALGFKVFGVKEAHEFKSALNQALNQKVVICLVQDNIYSKVKDCIEDFKDSPLPVFMPFSKGDRTDLFDEIVRDVRLRATGTF